MPGFGDRAITHLEAYRRLGARRPVLPDPLMERVKSFRSTVRHLIVEGAGARLQEGGRIDESIAQHLKALEADPAAAQAHVNLISLCGRKGELDSAQRHYCPGLKLQGDHAGAHYNWGVLLAGARRFEEAADACRRALEINPFDPQAHNNLATLLAAQGKLTRAATHYQHAIANDPGHRLARFNLGRVLVALGRPQEAAEHFERLLVPEDKDDTLMTVVRTPYLRNIALLVSLVAITTLWTQFLFQAGAERHFAGSADAMTRFFGRFNSTLGAAALVIQIVATGPALRRFGLGVTILLLPVLLMSGIAAIAVTASLWAVLMTSAFDQGLRFSIDKATFELLYLPVSPATKTQVKTTIDLVVNRLADGAGAVLLGVATTGFLVLPGAGLGLRGVAIVSLLLVAMWILLALTLRRRYVIAIHDSITQHRLDAERAAGTVLDRTATGALAARLRDGELVEVLYALDVFRMQHRGVVHPAVRGLLGYPAAEVRSQAILVLGEALQPPGPARPGRSRGGSGRAPHAPRFRRWVRGCVAAALRSADAGILANALERADNVLPPQLRRLVLPLVDAQVSAEERVALAGKVVPRSRAAGSPRAPPRPRPTRRSLHPKPPAWASVGAQRRR